MTNDWREHNGGPQPVGDDVWVEIDEGHIDHDCGPAREFDWNREEWFQWNVINQHLIDTALRRGIELGLEAAARLAEEESGNLSTTSRVLQSFGSRSSTTVLFTDKGVGSAIRALNPDTIAKEAHHE